MVTLERLRDRGWRKWRFGPERGPNCILGALNNVVPKFEQEAAVTVIAAQAREQFPKMCRSKRERAAIIGLNSRATGFHDIEAVLEKAALRWDREHGGRVPARTRATGHVPGHRASSQVDLSVFNQAAKRRASAPELKYLSVFAQASKRRAATAKRVPVDRRLLVHRSFPLDQRANEPVPIDPHSVDADNIELKAYTVVTGP